MSKEKASFRKDIIALLLMMILVVSPLAFGRGGTAIAAAASDEIGYSISAEIPENQIDKQQTYFDLKMQPGLEQDLRVVISNETAAAMRVSVSAISASTNRNGIIDYRTPDIKDETLKIPFSEIATVRESVITVPAHGSYPAVVTVKMPNTRYDGVILGGITVTREDDSTPISGGDSEANISIENVYSYVVGVKLSETDVVVEPDFELVDVVPELISYQPAIVYHIRNKEAAIVKDLQVKADIYRVDSNTLVQSLEKNVDMAPNSTMPLSMLLDSELTPGEYRASISLKLGDEDWLLERDFSITAAIAEDLNAQSVYASVGLPTWAVLLIVFGVISAIACLILVIILLKKRRKEDDEE